MWVEGDGIMKCVTCGKEGEYQVKGRSCCKECMERKKKEEETFGVIIGVIMVMGIILYVLYMFS